MMLIHLWACINNFNINIYINIYLYVHTFLEVSGVQFRLPCDVVIDFKDGTEAKMLVEGNRAVLRIALVAHIGDLPSFGETSGQKQSHSSMYCSSGCRFDTVRRPIGEAIDKEWIYPKEEVTETVFGFRNSGSHVHECLDCRQTAFELEKIEIAISVLSQHVSAGLLSRNGKSSDNIAEMRRSILPLKKRATVFCQRAGISKFNPLW